VPYLVSKALLDFVLAQDPESLKIAGPGFISTTRLAHDNPALRAEIGRYNQKNIQELLEKFLQFFKERA
jgi:prephenate dehydrogenase